MLEIFDLIIKKKYNDKSKFKQQNIGFYHNILLHWNKQSDHASKNDHQQRTRMFKSKFYLKTTKHLNLKYFSSSSTPDHKQQDTWFLKYIRNMEVID